ncbi:hypothetical protein Aconfl_10520 [Algoriphagus confluentis]|uniref:Uncharacterized protein n=1 Tax=Algoriphagus confluentis TaxID=1697556 RepID=A0ABQ6PKB3_9BACT|nr:hypothetical protein Aconfl_10520 [Algoriphagus confluentis]
MEFLNFRFKACSKSLYQPKRTIMTVFILNECSFADSTFQKMDMKRILIGGSGNF